MLSSPSSSSSFTSSPSFSSSPSPSIHYVESIHRLLLRRNQLNVHNYSELFAVNESQRGKINVLKNKIMQLEGELSSRHSSNSVSASPTTSSTSSSSFSITPSASSSLISLSSSSSTEVNLVNSKLLKLQEELSQTYRTQSEMASANFRLKEKSEKDEKLIISMETQLAAKTKECETLKEQISHLTQQHSNRVKTLESTIEVMRGELFGSKSSAALFESKMKVLSEENSKLLENLLRQKDDQAAQLNQINEIIIKKEKEKEKEKEGKGHERESLTSKDGKPLISDDTKSIAVEMDFTSTNNIIDHVAWQSNFRVVVPTDRKKVLRSHRGPCMTARYNPSGTLIASGGSDGYLKVWDARNGNLKASLRGTKESVMVVNFTTDESLLMAAGNDQSCRIWSMKSSKVVHTLLGHQSKIYAGTFSTDGEFCITGSHDRTIRMWDIQHDGANKRTILCHSSCNSISLATNENYLASAHLDCHLRFWSLRSGELMADLDSIHTQQATGVDFSRDGMTVVSTSRDNSIKVLDVRTWKVIKTLDSPPSKSKEEFKNLINWNRATFSPDGQFIVMGSASGTVFVWNSDSGKCVQYIANIQQQQSDSSASSSLSSSGPSTPSSSSSSSSSSSPSSACPDTAITCVDWNRNGRQVIATDMSGLIHVLEPPA